MGCCQRNPDDEDVDGGGRCKVRARSPPPPYTFLGRTGQSWMEISCFYVLFYAGMSIFFGICLQVFLATRSEPWPKYTNYLQLMGPGMKVWAPRVNCSSKECDPLMFGDALQDQLYRESVRRMFLNHTNTEAMQAELWAAAANRLDEKGMDDYWDTLSLDFFSFPMRQVVNFDMDSLGPCSWTKWEQSWNAGHYCLYLSLNKLLNWVPILNETETVPGSDGDSGMTTVASAAANETEEAAAAAAFIPVTCQLRHPEKWPGVSLQMFPPQGIAAHSYPWLRKDLPWTAPLVALMITPTEKHTDKETPIKLNCTAEARNIYRTDAQPNSGFVEFSMLFYGPLLPPAEPTTAAASSTAPNYDYEDPQVTTLASTNDSESSPSAASAATLQQK